MFIIYGWTGGAQDAKAAARTSDLIRIVFLELQAQPDGPQYIMGDLNASVPDLASLQMALEETDDDNFTPGMTSEPWQIYGAASRTSPRVARTTRSVQRAEIMSSLTRLALA